MIAKLKNIKPVYFDFMAIAVWGIAVLVLSLLPLAPIRFYTGTEAGVLTVVIPSYVVKLVTIVAGTSLLIGDIAYLVNCFTAAWLDKYPLLKNIVFAVLRTILRISLHAVIFATFMDISMQIMVNNAHILQVNPDFMRGAGFMVAMMVAGFLWFEIRQAFIDDIWK